jgi:hypothetical protein
LARSTNLNPLGCKYCTTKKIYIQAGVSVCQFDDTKTWLWIMAAFPVKDGLATTVKCPLSEVQVMRREFSAETSIRELFSIIDWPILEVVYKQRLADVSNQALNVMTVLFFANHRGPVFIMLRSGQLP